MAIGHIPYLDPPVYRIHDLPLWGDLPIGPFVVLVIAGVVLGWRVCLHYKTVRDIDDWLARDLIFWALLAGFVVSHWVSVIFYFPERIAEDPWVLLSIFNGMSSVGGFLGAFIAMVWFLRKHDQPLLIYADMLTMGLLVGWCFGRAGCAWVHDHPGRIVPEGTWLAVGPWPCPCETGGALSRCCDAGQGVFRYDLGLLEFGLALALTVVVFVVMNWRNAPPGRITGLVALVYGCARVVLDVFRTTETGHGVAFVDPRYAGLTIAQWLALLIAGVGIWLLAVRRQLDRDFIYARESHRDAPTTAP